MNVTIELSMSLSLSAPYLRLTSTSLEQVLERPGLSGGLVEAEGVLHVPLHPREVKRLSVDTLRRHKEAFGSRVLENVTPVFRPLLSRHVCAPKRVGEGFQRQELIGGGMTRHEAAHVRPSSGTLSMGGGGCWSLFISASRLETS